MMSERNSNNIKQPILTPAEMKSSLEKINNSFSNYLNSLIKDFDKNPKTLESSVSYSTELIDNFKQFYNNFNIISDEILSNKTIAEKQSNISQQNKRNKIIIDNILVKDINEGIKRNNDKLSKTIEDNNEKITKYKNEMSNLPIFQIK